MSAVNATPAITSATPAGRTYLDLFLVSFLLLFFELTFIRWFGSTVVFLTFFINISAVLRRPARPTFSLTV